MRKKSKTKTRAKTPSDYNLLGYTMATRNVQKSTPNGRRAGSASFKEIPSKEDTASEACAAKRDRKEYTGSVVIGIAVMHKSNLVPVIDQKQAEAISKMRRN